MEYFTLENRNALIELNGREPIFIIREDDMNGWDMDCVKLMHEIIRELEIRNFDVPGYKPGFKLDVETAEIYMWHLDAIEKDFKYWGHELTIKHKKISVHGDMSGGLDLYVGKDWEADRKEFFTGKLFHRKMNNKPRINLHYNLQYRGWMHDNGCYVARSGDHREYPREENEPRTLEFHSVMGEVREFLKDIKADIMSHPVPQKRTVFIEQNAVQLTNPFFDDIELMGFRPLRYGNPREPFKGLKPSTRLVPLGDKKPDEHPYREHMNDGFVYLEMNSCMLEPSNTSYYNGYEYRDPACEAYVVKLNRYDNVWVIDASVFNKIKTKWFEDNPKEDRMEHDAFIEAKQAQAATMVHINDYKGGYEKPVVITNCRISADECTKVNVEEWAIKD